MQTFGRLRNFAARTTEAIERSPAAAFAALTAIYLAAVFSLSSFKLLWLDELITLHIAQLPSIGAIWSALARGADPNPPVTHILVHFSRAIFGDHEFAYRLPAVIGYWVGMLSLFLYLKRRLSVTWALAGTMMSMTMAAFDYSYESRSYGIFYGLAMLAFLCWSLTGTAKTRGRRWIALAGMALALAAGISTNYFAVLAFVPVAAGETVRTILRRIEDRAARDADRAYRRASPLRAIDFRVWIPLVLAALPLLAFRSMIAHSIAQFSPYAWNKASVQQVYDSYTEMVEIILYPILALFAIAIFAMLFRAFGRRLCADDHERMSPGWLRPRWQRLRWLRPIVSDLRLRLLIPADELAGIVIFMAYPIVGYIVASIRGGMLSPRFVIPVCFGFSIAATLVAFTMFRHLRPAGLALLCFLSIWFVARESVVGYWYEEQKESLYKVRDALPRAKSELPANAPIVVPDPLLALPLQHYAPKAVASRIVFPVDFPAIRYFRHDDSPEENLWAGRNFLYSLPIEPLATFQDHAGKYLIVADGGNWMLRDLERNRYPVARLPIETHAGAIGGFTPLAHGTPDLFISAGDKAIWTGDKANWAGNEADLVDEEPAFDEPQPFRVADNLPSASSYDPDGAAR